MIANRLAISSPSLGRHPSHKLDEKVQCAAENGFAGIEIVYGELKLYSEKHGLSLTGGARRISKLCQEHSIKVLSLAPFENFEGSPLPLSKRMDKAERWLEAARALGASYLQVPASYDRTSTGLRQVVVEELRQLSDLASATQPMINIAYEPMSWSTHYSTWESALDLIGQVDRPNFGLCLDSFHVLTKLWANPFDSSGKQPDAEQALMNSLANFQTHFPLEKLFFVQLSDGERLNPSFSASHPWYTHGEAPEFAWSRHARPFPGESDLGGYMPVAQILKACVVDTGFKGWVSMEVFDRRMEDAVFRPGNAALRAQQSWSRLEAEVSRG